MTDVPIPGIDCIPLAHAWPGWWSKLELCRPDIQGDVFYMDLDTTVRGDISHFAGVSRTTLLSDFYRPARLQSSLMFLRAADRARIWESWIMDPGHFIARYSKLGAGFNGDQNFIEDVFAAHGIVADRWQHVFPGEVVSFKVHCCLGGPPARCFRGIPDAARVVIFHGKPRPWDVGL